MPSFADQAETQRLDSAAAADGEPPSSWHRIDDDGTLAGETQRVGEEDLVLYGETQAPEDDEAFEFADGIGTWIKTQTLLGETQVVDEGGDLIEGARVVEDSVDSDASSTDDDEGSRVGHHISSAVPQTGGSCRPSNGSFRSFAAVRAASLRSSGLAAAKSMTSKAVNTEFKSPCTSDEKFKEQDNDVAVEIGFGDCGMLRCCESTTMLTVFDTKVGEIGRDDNFQKCTQDYYREESKSRARNPVAKKLLFELTSADEEATYKPNGRSLGLDSPCSPVIDDVAGLSYLGSQEPGNRSQANALDAVDMFLGVNDTGLSQEPNSGKTDTEKSPPIPTSKGAQSLAKKTDRRSPIGKTGTFEWNDCLEDEGGGEFFTRRKDSFFKSKDCSRKSHSQPPKPMNVNFGIHEKVLLGKKGANQTNNQKVTRFTCSGSKLMQNDLVRDDKLLVFETRTKKNLLKDLNDQSVSKPSEEPEDTNICREEEMYEVGPDTQMAAEAMEALIHGSPLNNGLIEADPATGKTTEVPSKRVTKKKPSLKSALSRESSSSDPYFGDASRHTKRKIIPIQRKESSISSRTRSYSKGRKSLEHTSEETKSKRAEKKVKQNLNIQVSAGANQCSLSFKEDKSLGKVGLELAEGVDRCYNLFPLNVQLSVGKDLVQGEFHMKSTPVAHRTRHSKAVKESKLTENEATDHGKNANQMTNARTCGTVSVGEKLPADSGELSLTKRKCPAIGSDKKAESERDLNYEEAEVIEGLQKGEEAAGSDVNGSITHLRRRRTRQTSSDKPNANDSLNNPSSPRDITQHVIAQKKNPASFKGALEILDTAKRKRRPVSSRLTSKIKYSTPDAKAIFISGVRTRSSMRNSSFKQDIEVGSLKCLSRPVGNRAGSADVGVLASTPPNQGANYHSQVSVAEENCIPEALPESNIQISGLACTKRLKDADAISPVCVAHKSHRMLANKGRSRRSLLARELIQLEASKSFPTLRRKKDMANIRVLFSHHLDDYIIKQQKKIMVRLGVSLGVSISDATHFIADKFVRTRNMLEAMALGKPVVTHMWLESCGQASCFFDEKNYILRDVKKEKEIGFSMPVSLAHACQRPLLQGQRVFVTENTKPSREVIFSLVMAAGGQPLERLMRSSLKDDKIPEDLLILSCEEDYSVCIPLLEKGSEIFSAELLLNGIVIQKLEHERHKLFSFHSKRTRLTIWL